MFFSYFFTALPCCLTPLCLLLFKTPPPDVRFYRPSRDSYPSPPPLLAVHGLPSMFRVLWTSTCPAQLFFTTPQKCFRLMFFLRRVCLDPPTAPSGLPQYTFSAQIVLPTALYFQSEFFQVFPSLTWFWVILTSTIPAAPCLKGSLSSPHATLMPRSTSRTIFSTLPGSILGSHSTLFRDPLSWIWPSRTPHSPPWSPRGTPLSPPLVQTTFHV